MLLQLLLERALRTTCSIEGSPEGGTPAGGGGAAPSSGDAPTASSSAADGSGSSSAPSGGSSSSAAGETSLEEDDGSGDDENMFGFNPVQEPLPSATPGETPVPGQTPAQATPPAQQQTPVPKVEPPPVAPPAAQTPAQQTPQQPGTGPQEPSAPTPTPAEPLALAEAWTQNQDAIVSELAKQRFALTQEEISELELDAPTAVPKLLAKTYLQAQTNMLKLMPQIVNSMIQKHMKVSTAATKHESAFYSRWPDLNVEKHGALVNKYAQVFRQANPDLTTEEMIEQLGPMVMMAAKVSPTTQPAAPGGQQTHLAPAAGTPAQTGLRPPPPSPFRPAQSGSPASPMAEQPSPWDGLGASHEET